MSHRSDPVLEPDPVLDAPFGAEPEPDALIQAAMRWHFSPETGSPFWLRTAETFDFDPRRDVRTFADLARFPNVVNQFRDVRVQDLIPRGYGPDPDVVGVYESGGTTGAPKRVVILEDWMRRLVANSQDLSDRRGVPNGVGWLSVVPSGPHVFGEFVGRQARQRGSVRFTVDLDPRWVRKVLADGRPEEAERYAEHVIDQAGRILETQDIGVLVTTPPLLERLARRDDLVKLVNEHVRVISWGGAHMDADTRSILRDEVFPEIQIYGVYGSTMVLGAAHERLGLTADDPCVFDPYSPYISFEVVDPQTRRPVGYGERGQVIMHHISRNALLPNNLERDLATRIEPPPGQMGDSVADVGPVAVFDDEPLIEGVY
ncbi:phenazine antibiotic biosynthesis protein [Frankia sp. Mgl5]|uniref:AMP-binding protein n=1 Tax=Frankia sp. Mgl5 TaxID=2933793 RepID=UPI00200D963F|nr:AMP-binding protein [Frankia sp. Mgl5]MCK9931022.1 phenazine antibiotic biosynthesis protein [Frankia sp. Mgl5]